MLIIYAWIIMALILLPIQLIVTAPYGRHTSKKWGVMIDNRLGWIIMEIVSPLCFAYFYLNGENDKSEPMWIFFGLWILHYTNRSLIYPLRMKSKSKQIPIFIVISALIFNIVNG